eukprot:3390822-Rhodomonas_salina.2
MALYPTSVPAYIKPLRLVSSKYHSCYKGTADKLLGRGRDERAELLPRVFISGDSGDVGTNDLGSTKLYVNTRYAASVRSGYAHAYIKIRSRIRDKRGACGGRTWDRPCRSRPEIAPPRLRFGCWPASSGTTPPSCGHVTGHVVTSQTMWSRHRRCGHVTDDVVTSRQCSHVTDDVVTSQTM